MKNSIRNFNTKNLLLVLVLANTFLSCSQNIKITQEKLISSMIDYPLNEPHLIVDPNNENHIMVGSILTKEWEEGKPPNSYIVLLQSWDKGVNWEETHFDHKITLGVDPWLSMNNKGTLILTSLNKLSDQKYVYLLVFISKDGGKTWDEDYLNLGYAHDRQSIVIDPKTQDFIIASAKYNRNSDNKNIGGLSITRLAKDGSFKESNWHALSNIDKNNGTPFILPNGDLFIPYVDYMVNNKMLKTRRNWLLKSTDLGRTISENILIDEDSQFPTILLDTINGETPKLHYLKPDGKFREHLGYSIITSANNGYSWSDGIDIDHFQGENPYIRNAQMAINLNGVIGVFWFDRRYISNKKEGHDLYFSYSNDNVKTFNSPTKISSKSSFPNEEANGMVDKRWPTGGDYYGVTSTKDNSFHVVWVDHRNGSPQLFYAEIEVDK